MYIVHRHSVDKVRYDQAMKRHVRDKGKGCTVGGTEKLAPMMIWRHCSIQKVIDVKALLQAKCRRSFWLISVNLPLKCIRLRQRLTTGYFKMENCSCEFHLVKKFPKSGYKGKKRTANTSDCTFSNFIIFSLEICKDRKGRAGTI